MLKIVARRKTTKDEFVATLLEIHSAAQVDLDSKKLMAAALTTINDICAAELEAMDVQVR